MLDGPHLKFYSISLTVAAGSHLECPVVARLLIESGDKR